MGWFQRYFNLFETEPGWLIVLISVAILAGTVVIVEKMFKFSIWLLIVGVVAAFVMIVGSWVLFV